MMPVYIVLGKKDELTIVEEEDEEQINIKNPIALRRIVAFTCHL